MNEWISVKDRLPEEGKYYLIYDDFRIWFAHYRGKVFQDKLNYYKEVTHWMPLPDPPREAQKR